MNVFCKQCSGLEPELELQHDAAPVMTWGLALTLMIKKNIFDLE
jgi:hypothetical protein